MSDIAHDGIPEITLGWRLRIAMEHAGIKADDMAAQLGVHRGTITRWTHDIGSPPRPIYLERWADLCRVSPAWLAGSVHPQVAAGGASIRRSTKASNRGCSVSTRQRVVRRGSTCGIVLAA